MPSATDVMMKKRQGIAVYGSVLVDKINSIGKYPDSGELTQILSVKEALGGAVPNVATDLKRLDPSLPVFAGGRIGNDPEGESVIAKLTAEGVDTSGLVRDAELGTSFTQVMSVVGGQRTFFTYPGASSHFGVRDVDLDGMTAQILHLGYFLLLEKVDLTDGEIILREAKKRGIITSIDLVSENSDRYKNVIKCLPYVDYLIINEYEAGMLTGIEPRNENLKEICSALMSCGVKLAVIIHKSDMAVMMSERGFFSLGSLILPDGYVKGTTGAGDAFCSGALIGLLRGGDEESILRFASSAAAVSLAGEDAVSAVVPIAEVQEKCKEFERIEICL